MRDEQSRFLGLEVADSQPDSGSLSTIRSENAHDVLPTIITPYRAEPVFPPRKPASRTGELEDVILVDKKRDKDGSGSSVVADRKHIRRAYRPIYKRESLRRARENQERQEISRLHDITLSQEQLQGWLLERKERCRGAGKVSPTYYVRERKQRYNKRK